MRGGWADWQRSNGKRWLLGAGFLLILVLVIWRDSISQRLVPDPRMNRQLERAQAALVRGELSAADGSGARELFESVLAADPDQMIAREGLIAVRNAAVARAQLALNQHRLAQAARSLALAQELSAPAVQLQALRARLHDREEASGDIPALLAKASAPGVAAETALALLNQVLQLDAENASALESRRQLLAGWLSRAEQLLLVGDVGEARRLVQLVSSNDPAHLDLPPVQAKLGQALAHEQRQQAQALELALQAQRQAADFHFRRAERLLAQARRLSPKADSVRVAQQRLAKSRLAQKRLLSSPATGARERLPLLIEEGRLAIARGDFITPPGSSAWDKLRVAAAIAPDSSPVLKLQREFALSTRSCFEKALTESQLKHAQACLEASLSLEPVSAQAAESRHRLAERWLAYAEERIGASDFPEAEQALRFARHWQPGHPLLKPTEARLRRARGAAH